MNGISCHDNFNYLTQYKDWWCWLPVCLGSDAGWRQWLLQVTNRK